MAAVVVVVIATSLSVPVKAQKATRRVFVSATDGSGAFVSDLAAADFTLTEGGVPRQISRVAVDVPMRVLLLVDSTSAIDPMLTHMRNGLQAFFEGLSPVLEVGFITTSGQLRVLVPPGTDRQKLRSEFQAFSPQSGGNAMIDALLEADARFLKNAPDRWPVFVLITTDSGSLRGEPPLERYNKFVTDFVARGGNAHAIVIQGSRPGVLSDIIGNLVTNTNGSLETMNIANALGDKMKALAARISADQSAMKGRYEVEFTGEAKAATGSALEIGVARRGVALRVSPRRPF
jgi:hypothetical protein